VDALRRNQWSASAGIGGRLAPELVVGFPRIMQAHQTTSIKISKILISPQKLLAGRRLLDVIFKPAIWMMSHLEIVLSKIAALLTVT
jgi:hypothetical protein